MGVNFLIYSSFARMSNTYKTISEILQKLNISALNEMQEISIPQIKANANTVLLAPTGSGKTLTFLLPLIESLNEDIDEVQALILVPTRELAIQIETVARTMGSGFKVNAAYGGRSIQKDKAELSHVPAILIGTPGRIADHFRQERLNTEQIKTIVLDEFDKSLQVGFEVEMKEILSLLPNIEKRILTSATQNLAIPKFIGMVDAKRLEFLKDASETKLTIKKVLSETKDKLEALKGLLNHLGNEQGIIFCNFKDTIQFVSDFLYENDIDHGIFHGGMEQRDREEALIMFRNGTVDILLATDLAARGIDIPEMNFIIHYQLPHSLEEFTHRNGRTARVNAKGTAYVLHFKEEELKEFIPNIPTAEIPAPLVSGGPGNTRSKPYWETLFITGGRKDKISKGDVAGLFFKEGGLKKDQLGVIELKQNGTYVAVPASIAESIADKLNNSRLKKKKVRIYVL